MNDGVLLSFHVWWSLKKTPKDMFFLRLMDGPRDWDYKHLRNKLFFGLKGPFTKKGSATGPNISWRIEVAPGIPCQRETWAKPTIVGMELLYQIIWQNKKKKLHYINQNARVKTEWLMTKPSRKLNWMK